MNKKFISLVLSLLIVVTFTGSMLAKPIGEIQLDKPPTPTYKQRTVEPPESYDKLNEYMEEMDQQRKQGIYNYSGSRSSGNNQEKKSNDISSSFQFDGKRLTNECPSGGVWEKLSDHRADSINRKFGLKYTAKEIMDMLKERKSVQPLIDNSAFTIKFNPYSPEPIFGPEAWRKWLPSDGNANGTIYTKSKVVKDNASGLNILVGSDSYQNINRKKFTDAFTNLVFVTTARLAKEKGYSVCPDFVMMVSRIESGFNTNKHTKKNNFWGIGAYNDNDDASFKFDTIEEGLEYLVKLLACYSPDDSISRNCPEAPGWRNKHQYGSSPMAIEDAYSFPNTWDNELKQPWHKVLVMVGTDIKKMLNSTGKTFEEVFGKCDE